jgi:hypothetical protein
LRSGSSSTTSRRKLASNGELHNNKPKMRLTGVNGL